MFQMISEFGVGEKVWDDLTGKEATVVGVQACFGTCDGQRYSGLVIGYWLDNDHVHGGRHPWEISKHGNNTRGSDLSVSQ